MKEMNLSRYYKNIFVIIILISVFSFLSCGSGEDSNVYKVKKTDFTSFTPFVGELYSVDEQVISSPFDSKIIWMKTEGVEVDSGEIVVRLDTEEINASIQSYKLEMEMAQKDLEIFDRSSAFERRFKERDLKRKEISLQSAKEKYEYEKDYVDSTNLLKYSMNREVLQDEIQKLQESMKEYEKFSKKGFISKDEYLQYQFDLETKKKEIKRLDNNITITKRGRSEVDIMQVKKQYEDALKSYEQAKEALDTFDEKKKIERENMTTELKEKKDKVEHYRQQAQNSVIKANRDGVIIYNKTLKSGIGFEKLTVGSDIYEGDGILTISDRKNMGIKLDLYEFDLKGIQKGDHLEFALDSDPENFYNAVISRVGNIAYYNENDSRKVKKVQLKAKVQEDRTSFKVGMTVSGRIFHDTPESIITVPTYCIKDSYVKLTSGKKRKVKTGRSNYFDTEILDGLKEGDRILLSEKKESENISGEPIKVKKKDIRLSVKETGILEAVERTEFKSPARAKVLSMIDEGSEVKKGDVIVNLEKKDYEEEKQKIEADLALKKEELQMLEKGRDNEIFKKEQEIRLREIDYEIAKMEYEKTISPPPERELKTLELDYEISGKKLENIEKEVKINEEMNKKGYVSDDTLRQLKNSYYTAKINHIVNGRRLDSRKQGSGKTEKMLAENDFKYKKLDYEMASQELENQKALYSLRMEKLKLQIKRLEKRLQDYKDIIDDMDIKAGDDGVVGYIERWTNSGRRKTEVGDEVWNGAVIGNVARVSSFIIKARIPETEYPLLEKGQKVFFTLPADKEKKYEGVLDDISLFAQDNDSGNPNEGKVFDVIITVISSSKKFQPNISVNIEIVVKESKDAVYVPKSALYADKDGNYVITPSENKKRVKTGISDSEDIEVLEGLKEGDAVLDSSLKKTGEKDD